MKYIEELSAGETFLSDNIMYLLSTDFKKNGSRLGFSLNSGFAKWFESDKIIEPQSIYFLDADNNIIPIKETPKNDL